MAEKNGIFCISWPIQYTCNIIGKFSDSFKILKKPMSYHIFILTVTGSLFSLTFELMMEKLLKTHFALSCNLGLK